MFHMGLEITIDRQRNNSSVQRYLPQTDGKTFRRTDGFPVESVLPLDHWGDSLQYKVELLHTHVELFPEARWASPYGTHNFEVGPMKLALEE